jgi:hypothetical protein
MDVTVAVTAERKGSAVSYLVTLQAEVFELNIRVPEDEVAELKLVTASAWEDGSLQIGESAGAPVFWSTDEGMVAILIGEDDENWDIALSVPPPVMDSIIAAIAAA